MRLVFEAAFKRGLGQPDGDGVPQNDRLIYPPTLCKQAIVHRPILSLDPGATRRQREADEHAMRLEHKAQTKLANLADHSQHTDPAVLDKKRSVIEAALERARAKRQAQGGAA